MSDEEAPPPAPTESDSVPPPDSPHERNREGRRRRLEGVIPEIVRRAVELGVEKAQEAPDNLKQFVGDMKLPKEIAHYLLTQIDETKNGLFRVVAKEIRDFLEHTNFAGEVQKLLTTVQFEVNTTIRFTPNDGRAPAPKKEAKEADLDDDDVDADGLEPDEAEPGERRTPLPKPEVRTAVHVRREDRERRRRRDRGT
jgi:hypothetical protein